MSKPIPREIKEQVLNKIRNEGVTGKQAADEAGISSKTVYGWLAKEAEGGVNLLELAKLRREKDGLLKLVGMLTYELDKQKKNRGSQNG